MIYANQAMSLARDIAVRSVIQVYMINQCVCPLIDHGQQPMKMHTEVT